MKSLIKDIKTKFTRNVFKKILGVLILSGLGIAAFSQNVVYAQNSTDLSSQSDNIEDTEEQKKIDKLIDINEILDFGLKLIYALLWPVLFIAGGALDNTWVYGSFLHLDASLWSLWNIMKNFANFALGFMVLFAIVRNVFDIQGKLSEERSPVNIIKKTLIAGVLIQMSWFLMAAVIDLSTIMTYSIGGLPMTVLQNNPVYEDMPILGINASLEGDEETGKGMDLDFYSTYGDKSLSQCRISKMPGFSGQQFIVGRQKLVINSGENFEPGICSWAAWPYKYNEMWTGHNTNVEYKDYLNNAIKEASTGDVQGWIDSCSIIPLNAGLQPEECQAYGFISKDDTFFKDASSKVTINSLLEQSKGFVGPFITIYSSILDFSSLSSSPDSENTTTSNTFRFVIKFLFAAALFFPLLALAAVLIARIGMLRLAIVMSPILVLLNVFSKAVGDPFNDGMLKHFSLPNLINLIFAPVFVVFTISMSLIFLTALNPIADNANSKIDKEVEQMKELGITMDGGNFSILGLVDVDLGNEGLSNINKGKNTFSWLITNLFSVGIIWFFLFMAVKLTTVGESIGSGIQKSVETMLGHIPIVPIPGGGSVGLMPAKRGLTEAPGALTKRLGEGQFDRLKESMPTIFGELDEDSDKKKKGLLAGASDSLRGSVIDGFAGGMTASQVWNSLDESNRGLLKEQGITESNLSQQYNTYVTNNMSQFDKHEDILGKSEVDPSGITTYDAENLSIGNIENMANSGGSWQTWAKGVLGGNVKTANGIRVMVNKGTHADPQFKLVDQKEYNEKYLGIKEGESINEDKLKDDLKNDLLIKYGLTEEAKKTLTQDQINKATAEYKKTFEAHELQLLKLIKQAKPETETSTETPKEKETSTETPKEKETE